MDIASIVRAMKPHIERLIADTRAMLLGRAEAAKVIDHKNENDAIARSSELINEGLKLRREAGL